MNRLCNEVVGVLRAVYRSPGRGHTRRAYQEAVAAALDARELPFERNVWLPEHHKGLTLMCGYSLDFLIDDCLAIQVMEADIERSRQEEQLRAGLRQSGQRVGLLVDFQAATFDEGLKRVVLYE